MRDHHNITSLIELESTTMRPPRRIYEFEAVHNRARLAQAFIPQTYWRWHNHAINHQTLDLDNANVGYGFINLVHPGDVVTLAHALDPLSRGRYVGLSYATIQGIDCIRQKFRNSAVMTEAPDYRPKLFISYADIGQLDDFGFFMAEHQVGSERRFPLPDNDSKRMRSIGNAQTQGLWAPRGGVEVLG